MKKSLLLTLILALCCGFISIVDVCYATDVFTDNFDSYALGSLASQGSWSVGLGWEVVNDLYHSAPQSIHTTTCNTCTELATLDNPSANGTGSFWFYLAPDTDTSDYAGLELSLDQTDPLKRCGYWNITPYYGDGIFHIANSVGPLDGMPDISLGVWHLITFIWSAGSPTTYTLSLDGGTPSAPLNCSGDNMIINRYTLTEKNSYSNSIYVDNFGAETKVSSILSITSPETGSTITDDTDEITISWFYIDSLEWTNIKMLFNDYQISESSAIVNVPITSDNGSADVPISAFNLGHNGGWILTAIVENPTEYNFDIPNPPFTLILDVEGWPEPYVFTDFETWYSENVVSYEDPSDWAITMTGFVNPIFEKVGEFGDRIDVYLNISEAYSKGLALGGVFPVLNAYILKINIFFGGFPIVQFFQWAILAIIGLFGIKIILKLLSFIPFIGGGG